MGNNNARSEHLVFVKLEDAVSNGNLKSYQQLKEQCKLVSRLYVRNPIYINSTSLKGVEFTEWLVNTFDKQQDLWIRYCCLKPEMEYLYNNHLIYLIKHCKEMYSFTIDPEMYYNSEICIAERIIFGKTEFKLYTIKGVITIKLHNILNRNKLKKLKKIPNAKKMYNQLDSEIKKIIDNKYRNS